MLVEIDHADTIVLMRSLLRSLEETPEGERAEHQRVYNKISRWHTETLPPHLIEAVGRAVDHATGRDR